MLDCMDTNVLEWQNYHDLEEGVCSEEEEGQIKDDRGG